MQDEPAIVNENLANAINKDQENRLNPHGSVLCKRTDRGTSRRPQVLKLIAIYAIVCLIGSAFLYLVVPNVIASTYNEPILSLLKWLFPDRKLAPIQHYLDLWGAVCTALLIATILHLGLVLFIQRIDRKHQLLLLGRADVSTNTVLIVFAAMFLALTIFSGIRGDYLSYLSEWKVVLAGRVPWLYRPVNAYGPLFNVLAPLVWLNPLANKLLFAFSYLCYVIWLIKDFALRRGMIALSLPWLVFWLLNPFPWVQIAYFGYFDVLVALACVAAVHSFINRRDGACGTYLALGILLKYLPAVILPFLAFNDRRLHIRMLGLCVGLVTFGLAISIAIYGKSTLFPLLLAATRPSTWSIYAGLASTQSPLRLVWDWPSVDSLDWLEKPLLIPAGFAVFLWCFVCRTRPALSAALAVLVTLVFYRVGFINYQMVLFLLISYWVVSEWQELLKNTMLVTSLVVYFTLLSVLNLINWGGYTMDIFYSSLAIFKFILGCILLLVLAQFSAKPQAGHVSVQIS
jgi:hypothetical protein